MNFRLLLVILLSYPLAAHAENWPQFRGPYFNGSTTESNLPAKWSTTENVVWTADLPGPSAASPIVWNDKVFVSSTDPDHDDLVALCFDRESGKQLWAQKVADGNRRDSRSNFAAPTPATNGEVVVFF